MRKLLAVSVMLIWFPQFALSQQSLPDPLQVNELRQILAQLYELKALREQVAAYQIYVERDREQDAREKASYDRSLELERQATALAERETNVEKMRGDMYENLYRSLSKKPGWGCTLKRIFTLGIARCGG